MHQKLHIGHQIMSKSTWRACSETQSPSITMEGGDSFELLPPFDPFFFSSRPPPPSDLREHAGPPPSVGGVGINAYTNPRSELGLSLPMTSPTYTITTTVTYITRSEKNRSSNGEKSIDRSIDPEREKQRYLRLGSGFEEAILKGFEEGFLADHCFHHCWGRSVDLVEGSSSHSHSGGSVGVRKEMGRVGDGFLFYGPKKDLGQSVQMGHLNAG